MSSYPFYDSIYFCFVYQYYFFVFIFICLNCVNVVAQYCLNDFNFFEEVKDVLWFSVYFIGAG